LALPPWFKKTPFKFKLHDAKKTDIASGTNVKIAPQVLAVQGFLALKVVQRRGVGVLVKSHNFVSALQAVGGSWRPFVFKTGPTWGLYCRSSFLAPHKSDR